MDLGFVDPSAIIGTLYDRLNKTIYVYTEFYKSGCQLSELADVILEKGLRNNIEKYSLQIGMLNQLLKEELISEKEHSSIRNSIRRKYEIKE